MLTPAEIADLRIAIAHLKSAPNPDALPTADALQGIIAREYRQPDIQALVVAIREREREAEGRRGHSWAAEWPTNAELGGNLTGTRDDEYKAAVHEEAGDIVGLLLRVREAQQ